MEDSEVRPKPETREFLPIEEPFYQGGGLRYQ